MGEAGSEPEILPPKVERLFPRDVLKGVPRKTIEFKTLGKIFEYPPADIRLIGHTHLFQVLTNASEMLTYASTHDLQGRPTAAEECLKRARAMLSFAAELAKGVAVTKGVDIRVEGGVGPKQAQGFDKKI